MARPMPEEDPVTMATRPASGWVPSSGMHRRSLDGRARQAGAASL